MYGESKMYEEKLTIYKYKIRCADCGRKKVSHKIHKNKRVNNEDWVIIPNHHKAIISKKDFDKVQEL